MKRMLPPVPGMLSSKTAQLSRLVAVSTRYVRVATVLKMICGGCPGANGIETVNCEFTLVGFKPAR